jgi:tetratricopeptide (TPR) repeat protein
MVIICCSIDTSWGQEEDLLNVSYPSSLLAKSEVTHDDILNHVERSLARSISIHDQVATVMLVLAALITIIVAILGIFGYFRGRELERYILEAKSSVKKIKEYEERVKKIEEYLRLIKEIIKEEQAEKKDKLGEETKPFRTIKETFPEDRKEKFNEYEKITKTVEALGVPLEPEDYLNRGNVYYLKEKYKSALNAYTTATELNPDCTDASFNRGVVLDKLGRQDEAIIAYTTATKLNPDYDVAWYKKSCDYSLRGNKKNALECLSIAIVLEAKYKEIAKKDGSFKNLWDDEDFKRIVS